MVINGDHFRSNPAEIISAVQDFMNLEQVIKTENFIHDRENGKLPKICFQKDENSRKDCSIITSSNRRPIYPQALVKKVNSFFKPYNDEFLDWTGARGSILPYGMANGPYRPQSEKIFVFFRDVLNRDFFQSPLARRRTKQSYFFRLWFEVIICHKYDKSFVAGTIPA